MAAYKLTYFDARGVAESIRLLCADNGLALEETPINYETLAPMKPNLPFGQVPAFHDGADQIVQSGAILRHLGRKHGLYGSTEAEATRIDMLHEGQVELRMTYLNLIYRNYEAGKEDYVRQLPGPLEKFEKLLAKNGGGKGFLVGQKISFVDYSVYELLNILLVLAPKSLDTFPLLKAFHAHINARPGIAAYEKTDAFKRRNINGNGKQ